MLTAFLRAEDQPGYSQIPSLPLTLVPQRAEFSAEQSVVHSTNDELY